MKTINGLWICLHILSFQLSEDLPGNTFHFVLGDSSLKSNLTDYSLDFEHERIGRTGHRSNSSEDDEHYKATTEKYKKDLYELVQKYEIPAELSKSFSIQWAGIKKVRSKTKNKANMVWEEPIPPEVDDIEHMPILKYDFGTPKPGSMPSPLTDEDIQRIIYLHNLYRTNFTIPSGNTLVIEYDQDLTNIAQKLVYQCNFPMFSYNENYSVALGVNMFRGINIDVDEVMWMWYSEYKDFDFLQWRCLGKECGHATQILWGATNKIGCAKLLCWPETLEQLLACVYYPPGNVYNELAKAPERGYLVGAPCSLCLWDKGGFCLDNKCARLEYCKENNLTCPCNLTCKNCGTLNAEKCTCDCKDGWDYLDCSLMCQDEHPDCPAWSDIVCDIKAVRDKYCRRKCGYQCRDVDIKYSTDDSMCCQGGMCLPGQEIKQIKVKGGIECTCEKYCPNMQCYRPHLEDVPEIVTVKVNLPDNGTMIYYVPADRPEENYKLDDNSSRISPMQTCSLCMFLLLLVLLH